MSRTALITKLAGLVSALWPDRIARVAIDGPDAAGKSRLAAELAIRLAEVREVVHISLDGFHRPRHQRHRRGHLSPEGYYEDSFDYHAVRSMVLDPLSPGGNRRYRRALFDHRRDTPDAQPVEYAGTNAVLLFDGVFLLRPELQDYWDLRIYVDVRPDEALRRALVRDRGLLGDAEAVRERYRQRYLPAQELYRASVLPIQKADVVIANDDPARPLVTKWPTG